MRELSRPSRRYIARVLSLFETPALASNPAGNELTPRAMELSPEARELWIEFHDAVETAMRPDGALAALRDVAGKAAEQAGRIAGVLQIMDDAGATDIGADAMERACELTDWHLSEAARLASEALIPPDIRDAQNLARLAASETAWRPSLPQRCKRQGRGHCDTRRGSIPRWARLKSMDGLSRLTSRGALGALKGGPRERLRL